MACECDHLLGGLGAGPLGSVPFGSMMPGGVVIGVADARPITLNQIAVPFDGDLGFPNPFNPDSALNVKNWTLTAVDPHDAVVRLVQNVQLVTDATFPTLVDDLPQLQTVERPAFLISFDGPLTEGALYELVLSQLELTPGVCDCVKFRALFVRCDAIPTDGRNDDGYIIDIANPYLSRDALRLPPVLGSYQVTDKGDVGLDKSGEASLRKRIQRRMVSATQDFFHLRDYGLDAKIKTLLTPALLQRLASRLRAQVLKEPEVVQVQVSVRRMLGEQTVVSATARVQTIGGREPFDVVAPIELP